MLSAVAILPTRMSSRSVSDPLMTAFIAVSTTALLLQKRKA